MSTFRGVLAIVLLGQLGWPIARHPPGLSAASPGMLLPVLDQAGGVSNAVALRGDLALLGVGLRVLAIDISTPTAPQFVGQSPPLPGIVQSIEVEGDIAFVGTAPLYGYLSADLTSAVTLLDIRDPTELREVATTPLVGALQDIDLWDGLVFVATERDGLKIIDARDPVSPAVVGAIDLGPGRVVDVSVVDGHALIANRQDGLQVIDVSVLASPRLAATIATAGFATAIAASDADAFVVTRASEGRTSSIEVFDVRDPSRPVATGSFPLPFVADAVRLVGDRLYVVGSGSIQLLDVGDGRPIRAVAEGSWGGISGDVAVHGDRIVAPAGADPAAMFEPPMGLRVILANDDGLVEAGTFDTFSGAGEVAASSDQLLVAADIGHRFVEDLITFDRTRPLDAGGAGRSVSVGYIWDIQAHDGLAYLATWDSDVAFFGGLRIAETRGATAPRMTGRLDVEGAGHAVVTVGRHAYVVGGTGLEVIDVADPGSPTLVARLPLGGVSPSGIDMAAVPGVLYIATGGPDSLRRGGTLRVISIADPAHPALLHEELLTITPRCLAISGSHILVGGNSGPIAFDITDPARPRIVGDPRSRLNIRDLVIDGNLGYAIVNADGGTREQLAVLDVRSPDRVMALDAMPLPDSAISLAIADGRLYVGGGSSGVLVLGGYTGAMETRTPTPTRTRPPTATSAPASWPTAGGTSVFAVPSRIFLPALGLSSLSVRR